MKIALLGYGKMGKMVKLAAARAGIEIAAITDPAYGTTGQPSNADVWIEFSEPAAVLGNIKRAAEAMKPIVVGTTGWYDKMEEVRKIVDDAGIGLVYGSNFSIGVNLMFKITERAADLFSRFKSYDPFIEEAHHKFKKDAPSGTAIFLKRIIENRYGREVPIASTRAGYIPGIHTVGFDSESDTLTITHTARGRSGLAEGAIVAAEWIKDRKGFYEFSQVMDERLKG